jgi:RNA polymerase sigma-70 factor (ECF subfamily)
VTEQGPTIADGDSDAVIIEAVLRGDVQRFAELVGRYQRALYRYAVALVLDHDAAADMVQDAFVRAYAHLRDCRDRTKFRTWLFQTLRNRCLDYWKEARRRHVPLEDAGPIVDPGAGPADLADARRVRAAIAQALAALSPQQREAFILRYVDEVPYDEMAELLDASVSALKMRVLRAREALAAVLTGDVTESVSARLVVRRG